ncbi:MAG: hypothetical protein IJ184_03005 [Alphaproteobacteria bacterium]|nr:hypothetical protein [Alphaproteobacteria bacterium]
MMVVQIVILALVLVCAISQIKLMRFAEDYNVAGFEARNMSDEQLEREIARLRNAPYTSESGIKLERMIAEKMTRESLREYGDRKVITI